MADVAASDPAGAAPTPEEIAEIMSDLSFFLEMDEATALPPEEEAIGGGGQTDANGETGDAAPKGGK